MKRLLPGLAALALFVAVSAIATLSVAEPEFLHGVPVVSARVPFEFSVGNVTLPAGDYEIQQANESTLMIRNHATSKMTPVMIMTRLASRGDNQVTLVFDQAEGKNYLSEVHVSWGDGFALHGASAKHTHASVKAEKVGQ
jgi:hypothetical protein